MTKYTVLCLFVLSTGSLTWAQNTSNLPATPIAENTQSSSQIEGHSTQPQAGSENETALLTSLGEIVVKDAKATGADAFTFSTSSDDEPSDLNSHLTKKLTPFIGRPLKFSTLAEIRGAVAAAFEESGEGVVGTAIPEQDITDGTLRVVYTHSKLGVVKFVGNQHFRSDGVMQRGLTLRTGDQVNSTLLRHDLDWLSRNPFRNVSALYGPGAEFGEVNVSLLVQDQRPWTAFAGYDREGTELLGADRFFAGFQHGNVLGLDHQISYQYFTDGDFTDLHGHFASYTIPIHRWKHEVRLSGFYAETEAEFDVGLDQPFDSIGQSWQGSLDYIIPLKRIEHIRHEFTLGFDFKSTNSNLEFGELEVFDTNTEIAQFHAQWSGRRFDRLGVTALRIEGVWSPGDLTNHNADDIFTQSRALAGADYVYGKAGIDRLWSLPAGFTLRTDIEGQASNGNLLSSEQFLLTGEGSVRGFERSLIRGDEGYVTNIQLNAPPMVVWRTAPAIITPFGFYDHGWGRSVDRLPDEPDDFSLSSAGLGLSGQVARNFSFTVTYGWQLDENGFDDGEDGRWHLGATTRF